MPSLGCSRASGDRRSERLARTHSSNVLGLQSQVLAISPGPGGLAEGRGFIARTLAAAGFDAGTRYQVIVATNEAVSNAMEHGVPCDDGHIHLAATVEYGSFVFSVRDCGEFEHAAAPAPEPVAERGRGFAFMNLLMDDVQLEARPGKTVLRLAKRLPGTPPPPREADPAAAAHNLRAVHELFDAFAARDVARTLELVDRGVMVEPLSTPVARRTPYLGVSGLRRYLRDLDETWEEFDVTIADTRADGAYAVAVARVHARQRNVALDDPVALVFKFRDSKIVWSKFYWSEADALAAAGWA
jgi:anti-sigma regulatory factor (Ser/Thr protein kinase)/ketosteroid isomerase-like protein